MNILGLSTFADSSAAIVRNGRVLCAVEEERLNRIKHYDGMPWLAVNECMEIAHMSLKDIDVIAIGWNPFRGWGRRIAQTARSALQMPGAFRSKAARGAGYARRCKDLLRLRRSLAAMFDDYQTRQKKLFVDHHLAHAACAFLPSPYQDANIVIADGTGEFATISFLKGEGNSLARVGQIKLPDSLGHVYAAVTGFLGFRMTYDEGKVMGLAAYGEDTYRELFSRLVRTNRARRTIEVDTKLMDYHAARNGFFSKQWLKLTGMPPRKKDEPLTQQHKDLARSLQQCIEEKVFYLLGARFPGGRQDPLCAAGGLFLNSVMNGKIVRDYTSEFFVQPAAGDNGVSLGAALYADSALNADYTRHPFPDAYLGREYRDAEIRGALSKHSISPRTSNDIFSDAADLIVEGKVVGWYRGRMEFGPRALGNRSILASPSIPGMKDTLNLKVKHREGFRPFACSVMLDEGHKYFDGFQRAPFMLKVFQFKKECRHLFPAICHADFSCRIQTITPQQDLYRLLAEIKKRTGHGVVLNTSMNVAGEPIVNTPDEAICVIRKTDLDVMILESHIIRKEDFVNRA